MDMQEIRAKYPMYKDLSDDQLLSGLHEKFYSDIPYGEFRAKIIPPTKLGKDAFEGDLRKTLQETDWGTRNIASAGTALSNLWEGAKQFVGQGNRDRIDQNQIIRDEAPLGAIAGEVALTSIPFAAAGNSIKAAGAVGAGYGLMQPVAGEQTAGNIAKGKTINTVVGLGTGAAGQYGANRAGDWIANKTAEMALKKSQNAVKDATLQESLTAGYTVPPSMMPDSGLTSRILEGVSGKYKTNQLAGIRNQETTNNLARQSIGLAEDSPLSAEAIQNVREAAYQPYRDISSLPVTPASSANQMMNIASKAGFSPKSALEELKQARSDAKSWFEAYNRSANPEQLTKAKSYQAIADQLENDLETYAKSLGKNDLVTELQKARKQIAKTYTIERALDKGSGNVNAKVIAKLFDKGKPLSDGLDTIGRFGSTFGDVAGIPKSGNANPFTILDAGYSGAMGMLSPTAAALPLARVASRYGILSRPAQMSIANPSYNVPIASRMTAGLLDYMPVGATALAVPSFSQQ